MTTPFLLVLFNFAGICVLILALPHTVIEPLGLQLTAMTLFLTPLAVAMFLPGLPLFGQFFNHIGLTSVLIFCLLAKVIAHT